MSHDFGPQIQRLEAILNEDFSRFTMWRFEQQVLIEEFLRSTKRGHILNRYIKNRNLRRHIPLALSRIKRNAVNMCKHVAMLRQDSPDYMNQGTHQLVLKVDDGWVAKAVSYREYGRLYALGYQTRHYGRETSGTIDLLQERLGFKIPYRVVQCTHNHQGIRISEEENGHFMILEDHTENGRYIVRDVEDVDLDELNNAAQVRDTLRGYVSRLFEVYEQRKQLGLEACVGRHNTGKDIIPELTKVFFLKIDPSTGNADVVPGDFDHFQLFYTKKRLR